MPASTTIRTWLNHKLDTFGGFYGIPYDSAVWCCISGLPGGAIEWHARDTWNISKSNIEPFWRQISAPLDNKLDLVTLIVTSSEEEYVCIVENQDIDEAERRKHHLSKFVKRFKMDDCIAVYVRVAENTYFGMSLYSQEHAIFTRWQGGVLTRLVGEIRDRLSSMPRFSFDNPAAFDKTYPKKYFAPLPIETERDDQTNPSPEAVTEAVETLTAFFNTADSIDSAVQAIRDRIHTAMYQIIYDPEPELAAVKFRRGEEDPLEFTETHYSQYIEFFGGSGNLYQNQLGHFDEPLLGALKGRVNYLHTTGQTYKGRKLPHFSEFIPPQGVKGDRILSTLTDHELAFVEKIRGLVLARNRRHKTKKNKKTA